MTWSEFAFEDIVEGKSGLKRGPFGGAIKKEMFVPTGFKIYEQKNAIQDDCNIGTYFISEAKFQELEGFAVAPGDLLVSCSGTMGKVTIVPPDAKPGIINQALLRIRPRTSRVSSKFLRLLLESTLIQRRIFGGAAGVAIKNIRPLKEVRQVQIPLPPLPEQKRIADILDAADALRAKRRESIKALDELVQSTFLEIFGDPVTNPKGWEVKPLGELGTLDRGVSKHRPRNDPTLLNGPYPLIQTGEVSNSNGYIRSFTSTYSELGLKQSKMWPAGTLCITIAANIANTGILTFDACFPDSVVGFSSKEKGRIEYVQGLFWFLREILERRAPQVAQKNINLKILRSLPVPLPSSEIQQRFAIIVESIEQQKSRCCTQLDEFDTLFTSLQSRAFNGEL